MGEKVSTEGGKVMMGDATPVTQVGKTLSIAHSRLSIKEARN